ncbi:tRNA lysidine(34) synthetase TilS [Desulfopila sp. IMCC35008]|uniref:tRNA lysidine(34) synthetase TilS n=1 Tax=Desulfopila sp. IMCC35008 TaxID=2653858 RepID=UPI0013D1DF47|nr:tRNA lysidine(34) synthetase TilS [Desulfopila sp. IMCC35008]
MSVTPHLIGRVKQNIFDASLFNMGDKIIVAVSGGSDSIALLHLLHHCDMDLKLLCVYVDHGLRPNETKTEIHCISSLCKQFNIMFMSENIDVKRFAHHEKRSTEESARILRYRQLEHCRIKHNCQAIAVGHTADDQVEEFYLRLIRGTGLKGLGGMESRNGNIIRPLLGETKSSLIKYLKDNDIEYCHDTSNDSREFLRNRVRLDLLPLLEQDFNPAIRSTTLNTMAIIKEDDNYLDLLCSEHFTKLCIIETQPDGTCLQLTLRTSPFLDEHPAIQRRILEKICWQLENRPSFRIISQLQHLIHTAIRGSRIHLGSGLRAQKERDRILFAFPEGKKAMRGDTITEQTYSCKIGEPGIYQLPELNMSIALTRESISRGVSLDSAGLVLDEKQVKYPLELRPPYPGEKMKCLGAPGRKKISRILNDLKIPTDEKRHYPLLADQNGPIAILGLRIADRVKITEETITVLHLQQNRT